MLSKACEYAIKATIFLASRSPEETRCRLGEIAKAIGSPVAFTAKILQVLVKNKILHSVKGAHGGFEFNSSRKHPVVLSDIVFAVDGTGIRDHCLLGLKNCSGKNPCPVHFQYAPLRENIVSFLTRTEVENLVTGLETGRSFLI